MKLLLVQARPGGKRHPKALALSSNIHPTPWFLECREILDHKIGGVKQIFLWKFGGLGVLQGVSGNYSPGRDVLLDVLGFPSFRFRDVPSHDAMRPRETERVPWAWQRPPIAGWQGRTGTPPGGGMWDNIPDIPRLPPTCMLIKTRLPPPV